MKPGGVRTEHRVREIRWWMSGHSDLKIGFVAGSRAFHCFELGPVRDGAFPFCVFVLVPLGLGAFPSFHCFVSGPFRNRTFPFSVTPLGYLRFGAFSFIVFGDPALLHLIGIAGRQIHVNCVHGHAHGRVFVDLVAWWCHKGWADFAPRVVRGRCAFF